MRKIFIGLIFIVIIALVGATYILPNYISNQVSDRVAKNLQTENVKATIDSTPGFKLLFGEIDTLDIQAENVKLDKVNLTNLTVQGNDIKISLQDLLLARHLVINSAQNLKITGVINESDLTKLLNEKVDKVTDIVVKINPDDVEAVGEISFLGQKATIHVKGNIVLDGKNLLFRVTDAETQNSLFGKIGISITKDIFLASADKLPLEGAKFTRVEQQNGQILIEAGINE